MPNPRYSLACAFGALLFASACSKSTTEQQSLPPLETVSSVDLERYVGTWYEIASYPQRFQKDCTGTTATYAAKPNGQIDVLNRCRKGSLEGPLDEAQGRARVVDEKTRAKLEVSFFGPFWGDYWIIDLDEDYRYAVVGHPGRDYLWILSREPQLDPETTDGILERLREQHYDTSRLQWTLQPPAEQADRTARR
ncbi:MAG: lipocalin family protein [Myxococcota bacterium]